VLALAVRVLHLQHDLRPVPGHRGRNDDGGHAVRERLADDEPVSLD
jgi:hypothetical protein